MIQRILLRPHALSYGFIAPLAQLVALLAAHEPPLVVGFVDRYVARVSALPSLPSPLFLARDVRDNLCV